MSKSILNKILFFSVVLTGVIALVNNTVAYDALDTSGYNQPSSDEGAGSNPLDVEDEGGDGGSDVDKDVYNVTQTTTTNENGEEITVTETSTYTVEDPTGTPTTETSDGSDVIGDGTNEKTTTTEPKPEEKKEEDLSQYTGLYNGRYILPDIMARHCRIKGEDVAKDVSLYVNCIKKYVADMNNENATAKAEAEKEFEILRYKTLLDAASNAMTKSQSILNYEETMNKYNSADQEAQTEFDDNHALIATMSFMIDVMNSFRELQVEQLKYLAINGIVDIDPAIVMANEEEEDESSDDKSSSGGKSDFKSTSSTYKIEQQ